MKTKSTVTTIRLNDDDLNAINLIQDQYGAATTAGAIRLALRQTANRVKADKKLTTRKLGDETP